MTIHYHGTPITPMSVLYQIAGRHFCVSFHRPDQVEICHQIGQSVLLDNGAFSVWKSGADEDWPGYYAWCDKWLAFPTTWAIIPDIIIGTDDDQDALIKQWPHGQRGAPVWHMHESIDRLKRLVDEWPRVCIGSSKEYSEILSPEWCRRMNSAWNAIMQHRSHVPWVHMLRGMQLVRREWPFASVDSTDIARNHSRPQNGARAMAGRWDAAQCVAKWEHVGEQQDMFAAHHPWMSYTAAKMHKLWEADV